MVSVTPKGYGWFLIELSIFDFSSNFRVQDLQKFSVFELSWSTLVIIKKGPSQVKDLINIVSVTPDGLWMVSDRIVKSQFFFIFHRSPAIIFSFSIIMENVSYP